MVFWCCLCTTQLVQLHKCPQGAEHFSPTSSDWRHSQTEQRALRLHKFEDTGQQWRIKCKEPSKLEACSRFTSFAAGVSVAGHSSDLRLGRHGSRLKQLYSRGTPNPKPYSPPKVDRIWGIWGSYYNIPKTIFYLLKGDYSSKGSLRRVGTAA